MKARRDQQPVAQIEVSSPESLLPEAPDEVADTSEDRGVIFAALNSDMTRVAGSLRRLLTTCGDSNSELFRRIQSSIVCMDAHVAGK